MTLNRYLFSILTILFIQQCIFAQNGLVRSYHPNGNLESVVIYVNDVLDGTARYFYDDGVLKEEKNYSQGKLHGWIRTYYPNGAPREEYYVYEGKLNGVARNYYENGGLKRVRVYNYGKLQREQYVSYDSTLAPPNKENIRSLANAKEQSQRLKEGNGKEKKELPEPVESIVLGNKNGNEKSERTNKLKPDDIYYTSVDNLPKPLGGPSEIFSKVIYPEDAKRLKIEGIVIVKAFVNELGDVTKTEVTKSIGSGCDDAAMKAVTDTKFFPAKLNGQIVKAQLIIPVKFKLEQ